MNKKIILNYVALIVWALLIFTFSGQGHEVSSGQSMGIVQSVEQVIGLAVPETLVRKGAHVFMYAVLGVLVVRVVSAHRIVNVKLALTLSLAAVCLYAVSDEMHQLSVPGRSGQVSDVLLDAIAGMIGICLYVVISKHCVKNRNDV